MISRNMPDLSIPMEKENDATYDEVPIVARCPSYQQPVSEAISQTKEAIRVCNSLPSKRGKKY